MTKLFSWNVNGIRAVINKGEFEKFLSTYNPDIICLQEIKAKKEQVEINLPNYVEYWYSADKAGYSGTALFSKQKPISVAFGFPEEIIDRFNLTGDTYGDPNKEGRVIVAEFEAFYVATVYTPNSKGDLSRLTLRHKHWDKAWLAYMKQLDSKKPVLFSGDLNVAHTEIDLANPKQNIGKHGFTNEEREGFSNFLAAGFVDTFRMFIKDGGHYSWWTHWANSRARNVGWRIDYWLASERFASHITHAAIHPEQFGSDHCPVSITIDL
ncbi:exodeoxyribonuclease III [Candidatus Saccharibacteria bacterium]|nr:exodeoxyribonuclease III [Candidatus Saccharibacteria bacterium]